MARSSTTVGKGNKLRQGKTTEVTKPKELNFATRLKIAIANRVPDLSTMEGYQAEWDRLDALAERIITIALQSPDNKEAIAAINFIADRLDGKPKQSTDVTSNGKTITPILGGISNVSTYNSDQEDS